MRWGRNYAVPVIATGMLALGCSGGAAPGGSPWNGGGAAGSKGDDPTAPSDDDDDDNDNDDDDAQTSSGDSGSPDTGPAPPSDDDAATTSGGDPWATDGIETDGTGSSGATPPDDDAFVPDADAEHLVDLVNAYRVAQGLPAIPQSNAMMEVAYVHAEDLHLNRPDGGSCNMHSWSNAGTWSACCYTPDHAEAQCMWDKPRELTDYPGNGYENAAGGVGPITPEAALAAWQGSAGHNQVILNQGVWATHPWQALGAAVYGDYAVLWFGEEAG